MEREKRPLSVFIITKNEELHLPRCLKLAQLVASEIIVLDSGSTDATKSIALEHGAQFFHRDFDGFGQQKYAAEQLCSNDWVLNLDADEFLTEGALAEIEAFLARSDLDQFDGARLKTINTYPIHEKPRFWADFHNYIRLYDKRKLNYPLHPTHDAIDVENDDRIYQFKNGADHFSFPSLKALDVKARSRTRFYFENEKVTRKWKNWLRFPTEFPLAFFKCYILRRHITGGLYGLRVSYIYAKYRFIRILQRLIGRAVV